MAAAVRVLPSDALDGRARTALRALLDAAFTGEDALRDEDWDHALGGAHAIATDGDGTPIAHASLVPRLLEHGGRSLQAGYVEAVAVHPGARGRGLGAAVMAAVEERIAADHDLGALGTTDAAFGFYRARGWEVWRGPTAVRERDGRITPTPDEDGGILVLPGRAPLDLDGTLACHWRPGDVW